ncbi:cyclic pyranopterin monophosphate synthase MoaC [Infirmifilum sp. NZ]|uniref:cyclic pyranopterin monophosphate synthase MoaC n=1 Tax=Infirmifilum sp. NZ TaxID=2926850 RepID=UPI0027A0818D|nr:cyclic pyranopterin monophosphate synthase MoaC [Infirmifilum sp. NZ]UNQ74264.1 cyclic pyranopterin monophosphate synthase MoaC [Infirmifilum sp. NZ]
MSGKIGVKMVDITEKPEVYREATASGFIRLKKETVKAILEGKVPKGDVLNVARVAAILAVKKTWEILPLCHPIPITGVEVDFDLTEDGVEATVTVKTTSKTGVEMEALTGVTVALLTVWDMVKSLEKDSRGQYPYTLIKEVRVLEKVKQASKDDKPI